MPSADTRWRSRAWLARSIRLVVFVIPVGIAFAVALLLTASLQELSGLVGKMRWVLIAGSAAIRQPGVAGQRRALPLCRRWIEL